jgi:hypothetical protein
MSDNQLILEMYDAAVELPPMVKPIEDEDANVYFFSEDVLVEGTPKFKADEGIEAPEWFVMALGPWGWLNADGTEVVAHRWAYLPEPPEQA